MSLYAKSPVKELNSNHFILKNLRGNVQLKDKKPTLIIFYANWCPHCHNPYLVEMMKTLGKNLPKKSNINVSAFDCAKNEENEDLAQQIGVNGFPTLMFFNKKGQRKEIQGPRTMENILKEMIKYS